MVILGCQLIYIFLRCKCIVLSPSLAAGIYEDGDQIRMGHTLEFRSGGDFMYRFRNNVRVGVGDFSCFECWYRLVETLGLSR